MQISNHREKIRLAISICLILFFSVSQIPRFQLPVLERLEHQLSDIRTRFTLTNQPDPRIVIIDIDDKSLQEIGQWPWSRATMATLVDQLFDHYQINTLGFDMVFAEPEVDNTKQLLQTLSEDRLANNNEFKAAIKDILNTESADEKFAQALSNRKTITGFIFHKSNKTYNQLGKPISTDQTITNEKHLLINPLGFTANLPILTSASHSSGFFDNATLDADGIYRRVPILQQYQNHIYPSLALAVAQAALNDLPLHIQWFKTGHYSSIEHLQLGSIIIPVDRDGAVIVPYTGSAFSFRYYTASDVLTGRIDHSELKDKIALVGTSAPGLLDLRPTPVGQGYPGVEVHANIVSGILNHTIPQKPGWAFTANILIVVLTGLLMILLVNRLSPTAAITGSLFIALIIAFGNLLAWNNGLVLSLVGPLGVLTMLYIWQVSYGYLTETRNKRKIAKQFGQYIPPELVDEMLARPDELSLLGENRNMTVLFSDIRGFTKLSEGLSPEQLTRLMNDILTPLTKIIHNNRGTIDKYMGDAIMAFWGAPLKEQEHAKLAVKTAMELQQKLHELQPELEKYGLSKLEMGIGINTGEMSVGNMGSQFRLAYTVMGDAVNLASRIEQLTKDYNVSILVSDSTLKEVPDLHCKPIDRVKVKGKSKLVEVFEPTKFD